VGGNYCQDSTAGIYACGRHLYISEEGSWEVNGYYFSFCLKELGANIFICFLFCDRIVFTDITVIDSHILNIPSQG